MIESTDTEKSHGGSFPMFERVELKRIAIPVHINPCNFTSQILIKRRNFLSSFRNRSPKQWAQNFSAAS
jgi:hypothetical protein